MLVEKGDWKMVNYIVKLTDLIGVESEFYCYNRILRV
jgi:hypothetical protein